MTRKEFNNLKDDDRITIIKPERPDIRWNGEGRMDKYIGKSLLKSSVRRNHSRGVYYYCWIFSYDCLVLAEPETSDEFNKACFDI